MLAIRNMSACYGESRVIRSLDLDVPDNKVVCLIGRNGVGKSTTLKSIMGLVRTPDGSIELAGTEMRKMAPYDRVRLGIGYVPQGRGYFSADDCPGKPGAGAEGGGKQGKRTRLYL